MTDMRDDLRSAVRSLRSSPTFTVVALLVLALGIGASTAIFSVVDAVVLRSLPFDEHDRLVAVGERRAPSEGIAFMRPDADPNAISSIAPQNYLDWVAQQQVFESIAALAGGSFTVTSAEGEPEELNTQRVTASFFDVLRERPAIGRSFTAENEIDGNHRVAILSDAFWRRRFGADPAVVGQMLPVEGGAYEIIGVMPADFTYPLNVSRAPEMWVPYVVPADERVRQSNSVSIYLRSIARLRRGVSVDQAQANMDQIAAALTAAYPDWNKDTLFGVLPLHDYVVGARTQQWLWMLLGAVGLVVLIACANVANLLLARSSIREREVGIRAALGAGRARLIRGLLTESLLLAAAGTVLGLVLALWGVNVLRAALPDSVPRVASIGVDFRVLGVAVLLSVVTGALFGIVPALQLSRPDLTGALREGARLAGTGAARQRLRSALVVAEVALAVVLLVGAALFIGSFRTLMKIDPGFNPDHVLTAAIYPPVDRASLVEGRPPDFAQQFEEILDTVRQAPGVVAAGVIGGGMPMGGSMSISQVGVPGRELSQDDRRISIRRVSPDYGEALGMTLVDGRFFAPTDRAGSEPVVILNASAARTLFPNESAVGQTVVLSGTRTVVGVVGDVYQRSLESGAMNEAYLPVAQSRTTSVDLVVRTAGDPLAAVPAVKSAVSGVLPGVPLRAVRSMEEILDRQVAQRRLNMLLLSLFGLLGLVIAAVGIYGVMAYIVAQRTREIGVRMALGATRGSVVRMVLARASILVAMGLVAGGTAAWYLASTAEAFLFRMNTDDPRVFASALGVLALAALLASAIPALRAASVDPTVALRSE